MKKIIFQSFLLIILIVISNLSQAQNLKKAFKTFYEGNFDEAYTIFTSGENKNSCIGIYGEALVLDKKPLKFMVSESEDSKKRKLIDKKLSAYYKVNLSESKLNEVSEKDLKALKEYFSHDKISELKKEIENFFLEFSDDEIYLNLITKLKEINEDSEFYTIMETKYIDKEFTKIKSKNYISDAEKLINKFPDNKRSVKIQRYVDSLRVAKATSIYSLSEIIDKYSENQFKEEIIEKIKKYNDENVSKIKSKSPSYQKLVVWLEFSTEKEALNKLVYWNNYYRKNNHKSPSYFYYELTDSELKKFALSNKYLLCEHSNYSTYDKGIAQIENNKSNYPESYLLDLSKGLKICSKEKVYKKGELMDTYGAIFIKLCGKYRFSSDPVYQSMQEKISELREDSKHEIIVSSLNTDSYFNIYPYDNPFPIKISISDLPEFDYEKDAVYVFFLSSYKDTYLFEVFTDKMDETIDRIEHKIGFYFRD